MRGRVNVCAGVGSHRNLVESIAISPFKGSHGANTEAGIAGKSMHGFLHRYTNIVDFHDSTPFRQEINSDLLKKNGISVFAVASPSEPCMMFCSTFEARSRRMVPSAAFEGSVAPINAR